MNKTNKTIISFLFVLFFSIGLLIVTDSFILGIIAFLVLATIKDYLIDNEEIDLSNK